MHCTKIARYNDEYFLSFTGNTFIDRNIKANIETKYSNNIANSKIHNLSIVV